MQIEVNPPSAEPRMGYNRSGKRREATLSSTVPATLRGEAGRGARDPRRLGARGRGLALQPRDGHALLARVREARGLRPAQGGEDLRRPRPLRLLPGRVAARRPGAAVGARRATRTSRSRSSRPAAPPACPRPASTTRTSASTTRSSARPCPTQFFPKGADWLQVGPSGPRRLRLAVEHLCQVRGGICFMVDLDPRWVIKLIKRGEMAGDGALQAPRRRPGAHPAARPRRTSSACSRPPSCSRRCASGPRSRSSASRASSAAAPR